MPNSETTPHITVILALCDGEPYLPAQLESYCNQSLLPTRVIASDDAPEDGTGKCFKNFIETSSRAIQWELLKGPGKGGTANFLFLLNAIDASKTDYVALSDQDDIWLPEKLSSAVRQLTPYDDRPTLLGTRSWEWDAQRDRKHLSRPIHGPIGFSHALAQNFAGGNTMVLNKAALILVQRCLPGLPEPAVHDWWLYQLVSGAGGTILFDSQPQLLYRQHSNNQIGANSSIGSKITRFIAMLRGGYKHWMDVNICALQWCSKQLTPEAQALLNRLDRDRKGPLFTRLSILYETDIHRKGLIDQAALWLAITLNKM